MRTIPRLIRGGLRPWRATTASVGILGVVGADRMVGPPLTGIAQRMYIAGVLPNEPNNMMRWIQDPPAVDSLTAMPDLGVSEADARHFAAYVYTLD